MVSVIALLAACSSAPETPAPEPAAVPAPAPVEAPAKPAGSIGGEPILPKPVVVGGIDNHEVEEGIGKHMDAINACYQAARADSPKLRGKVLVKFTISKDGKVNGAETRSTSLRNEGAETCLNEAVAQATFPALESGKIAIVQYPFVFPTPL